MKYLIGFIMLFFTSKELLAQHQLKALLQNENGSTLSGVSVQIPSLNQFGTTDTTGSIQLMNIPEGDIEIIFSYAGLEEQKINLHFPRSTDSVLLVTLLQSEEEEEVVIVTSTRSGRAIADIPTRVEIISGEELQEKGNMKPGDIRMLLNESTGIQTQQTSATSYSSSIRIQGLDGRYTQLLRDGLPLYSGFSGGLSLMQVAPLDLKQVEVIKGSSSTLYGGGAIAGLVNLVSKTPTEKKETSFLANGTSAQGLDLSGFYSQRFKNIGITIFGSRNTAKAYDPGNTGLTAIPEYQRYTINPRLFIYGKKTTANIGFSYIDENRIGGSMNYIENGQNGYFEKNISQRFTVQSDVRQELSKDIFLSFKGSFTRFDRNISIPTYSFEAVQQSSYAEINLSRKKEKTWWIFGANLLTDNLKEKPLSTAVLRDYYFTTLGGFIQNTWTPTQKISIETGVRLDHVKPYGAALLPRLSVLYKMNKEVTIRMGGGLGYKTPTVFNEESEKIQLRNVLPINAGVTSYEKSTGCNIDINYRKRLGNVGFSINQLFFYTQLNNPLILKPVNQNLLFENAPGHIDTKGMETNIRLNYGDFKLFLGYTYADVMTHFNNTKKWFPLTAKHRLNNVLMYEKEEKLKIGLEAYYYSQQLLSDGAMGKPYWICGAMAEKLWEHFSVFINFENFLDVRQTRFDTIYTGPVSNPVFRDIYAPVDGFVINGGIKLKW